MKLGESKPEVALTTCVVIMSSRNKRDLPVFLCSEWGLPYWYILAFKLIKPNGQVVQYVARGLESVSMLKDKGDQMAYICSVVPLNKNARLIQK